VLADRVVVQRGRAGTPVDDATRDVELVGSSLVRAARRDPPAGANQLTHFDAFFARPFKRSLPPLRCRFAAGHLENHDFTTPFQVRQKCDIT
jgi:hypothetical protein